MVNHPAATASFSSLTFVGEMAVGLASSLSNPSGGGTRSPVTAQLGGLLLFRDKAAELKKLMNEPDLGKPVDTITRVAYTEGFARKAEYPKALDYVKAPGPESGKLEASIAGAAIALMDRKSRDPAAEALPFIDAAMDSIAKQKGKASYWWTLQLIRMACRAGAGEKVKNLAASPAFDGWAKYEGLRAKLDKSTREEKAEELDGFKTGTPEWSFAWEALARHNARYGDVNQLKFAEKFDPTATPFLHLGLVLHQREDKR